MKSVGIIGSNGYTGSELVRLLVHHPFVEIQFLYSRSNAGIKISELYPDLIGTCDLKLTNQISTVDILFLCLPHKESLKWLTQNPVSENTLIIDLGNDFRLDGNFEDRNFIYGLPEINKSAIRNAKSITNPGCFATAIQLALLPLATDKKLKEVYTTGITGSTGAGQSLQDSTHFTWRANNISAYKTLTHQHVAEILNNLNQYNNSKVDLNFVPWRGDFARGIFTTSIVKTELNLNELISLYNGFYRDAKFVSIVETSLDMKQVVNTNKCRIQIEKHEDTIAIHSAIDNLLKGASGQAIQNMNIAMGWEETAGLNLKPIVF